MDGITFRWMEGPEACEWLNPTIEHRGWSPINQFTARALVAFKDERIIAFYVLQLFPHAEPMFVDPEWRGTGVSEELADRMQAYLRESRARGYMVVADNPLTARMCEARGMKRITAPVYIGHEMGE